MDPAVAQVLQQIAQNTSNLPALLPEVQKLFEKLDNRLEHLMKGLEHFTAMVDGRLQRIQGDVSENSVQNIKSFAKLSGDVHRNEGVLDAVLEGQHRVPDRS
ncbi:hypothetical protein ONZ45_g17844 [Pleurotus djamor]|nr:hypothetical protein ONZ45_g17844 [Pleurotus djamor]